MSPPGDQRIRNRRSSGLYERGAMPALLNIQPTHVSRPQHRVPRSIQDGRRALTKLQVDGLDAVFGTPRDVDSVSRVHSRSLPSTLPGSRKSEQRCCIPVTEAVGPWPTAGRPRLAVSRWEGRTAGS